MNYSFPKHCSYPKLIFFLLSLSLFLFSFTSLDGSTESFVCLAAWRRCFLSCFNQIYRTNESEVERGLLSGLGDNPATSSAVFYVVLTFASLKTHLLPIYFLKSFRFP